MMETTYKNKSIIQPKTMAELLPGLSAILSKDSIQTLTAKKGPRPTVIQTRTAEKAIKPLTIAEMRADLLSLKVKSPRKFAQPVTSAKKRNWNSSVKVENKTKSCTAEGQLKKTSVRKVLNFQVKQSLKPQQTLITSQTPQFPKPELRQKKSIIIPAKDMRISGVCKLQETPLITNSTKKQKQQIVTSNKVNIEYKNNNLKHLNETPKSIMNQNLTKPYNAVTPLVNISFKSNSDSSFLLKEKEINEIEEKTLPKTGDKILENIANVSPPISTPFKDYRSIHDFFNNSNASENSDLYNDNTIMCFDNLSKPKENIREESVIVSLCDLLNKASVTNNESKSTELDELLVIEKQTESNIKMIDNGIKTLNSIKESQLKSLQYVRKLINDKKNENNDVFGKNINETLSDSHTEMNVEHIDRISVNRQSVIKIKSPSYKIPKKNACLRKKVFHKSMPDVLNKTPTKETDSRALDMYMQMKQKMNFLNTPVVKHSYRAPDTPAITSHNLQQQLDKLFNCS